jgi:hypothetical protein
MKWNSLSYREVGAGDRGRTGDVQLGKLKFNYWSGFMYLLLPSCAFGRTRAPSRRHKLFAVAVWRSNLILGLS